MSTIKDVSRRTGLSISTISKYINGGNVRAENRKLIDAAIQSLGFKVNQAARSLKTNRTMKVGVLLPSLDVSFFAGIVSDVEARLFENGYNAIICSFDHSAEQEKRKLEFLLDQQVDGVILVVEHLTGPEIKAICLLRERATPMVLLDRHVPDLEADYVLVDSESACRMATEQFLLNGHKRIGLIMGPPYISTARERREGYLQALREHGVEIDPALIKVGDYSINAGYTLFGELLDMREPPTAILDTNYEMTLGAVTASFERKLKIPKDVSFIGYDDTQLTQIINPPITIVVQPTEQMAAQTAAMLLKRMRGDYADYPAMLRLRAGLMLHESIAPIGQ